MLKHIAEAGKYVGITGFRNVCIKNTKEFMKAARGETFQSCLVQFLDAERVAGWQHLYFAALNALLAFISERKVSKSLAMEVILHASAQRQIRKAIELMGVKCKSANVAVVIIGESAETVRSALSVVSRRIGKDPDDAVLEITEEKAQVIREAFGVTETELETVIVNGNSKQALVDLIIERVALLSAQL